MSDMHVAKFELDGTPLTVSLEKVSRSWELRNLGRRVTHAKLYTTATPGRVLIELTHVICLDGLD